MTGQPRYRLGSTQLPPQCSWQPAQYNHQWSNWPRPPDLPVLYGLTLPPRSNVSHVYRNGSRFSQPLGQPPPEVQRYLDVNGNERQKKNNESQQAPSLVMSESIPHSASPNSHFKSPTTKCDYPNCSFIGSRKVLKLHEIQCHREGKMQIVLDTPEQIAKWREERRRNYPTASNIAKKQEQQKQRTESGQILGEKKFRYNNRQGWQRQNRKWGGRRRGKVEKKQISFKSKESRDTEFNANLSFSNEETANSSVIKENVPDADGNVFGLVNNDENGSSTALNSGALGVLATMYAASSSDEEDATRDNNSDKQLQTEHLEEEEPVHGLKNKKIQFTRSGEVDQKSVKKKEVLRISKKKGNQNTVVKRQRPSLLKMLLAPDIRHERNVLLQCLRFIVRKDFFGIGHHGNADVS